MPFDPTRPTPGYCGCGCGETTPRRYRPGHDARHHSTLAAALTDGDWRTRTRAADLLADLGRTGYADRAALRAVAYRDQRGRALVHIADVARFQVGCDGRYHAYRQCPALTRAHRAAGLTNRITHLASDSSIRFEDSTPALVARLEASWDQCDECTVVYHRDEEAEHAETNQVWARGVTPIAPDTPLPAKVRKAGGWRVAADVDAADAWAVIVTLDPAAPADRRRVRRTRPAAPSAWAAPTGAPTPLPIPA